MPQKIIVTADDFGINEETNLAIVACADYGILTNTCIMANGKAFFHALDLIKNHSSSVLIGIHLNIIEGKSSVTDANNILTNQHGCYKLSFLQMTLKSWNKQFLAAVEREFRTQIKTVLQTGIKPDYLNSHVHIHAIPAIFEIVCRLAKEYQIPNVRTQRELLYFVKGFKRHFTFKYFINIIKNLLLNLFTFKNRKTLQKYHLQTNDYFIGVLYTGNMDMETIAAGIKRLPDHCSCEIIFHPTLDQKRVTNYREYLTLLNQQLKNWLKQKHL